MSNRLIKYEETPQVSGIEYKERFEMERNPKKKQKYEALAEQRRKHDSLTQKEVAKQQKGYKRRKAK
jgi:hypothetical protein